MEIPLTGARHRGMLLVASLAISAILIFQAAIRWIASERVESSDIARIESGAALEPGDAEVWDILGHTRQMDFLNPDLPGAIVDYQKAVAIDPLSARYWIDLAQGYEAEGDNTRAQDAFLRAKSAYPASGEVAFYYGNFLLREEKYSEAYQELRQAASADPSLLGLAVSRAWHATGDVNQLVSQVLPSTPAAYIQAINFFASRHQSEPALVVWGHLVRLGKNLPLSLSFPFLEELIREDRADDATRVWSEALAAAGLPPDSPSGGSLIRDGNFATDFSNGGLGWRWEPVSGATIDFDSPPGGGISRSIRLDFNGGDNTELYFPFEDVPVAPARTYHFHALMRTDGITTESGIRFSIIDPNHRDAVNAETDNLTGSHPWTALDVDVLTSPQTHFVAVELVRVPSRLFDNKLAGTVWIGELSLVPSDTEPGRPSR